MAITINPIKPSSDSSIIYSLVGFGVLTFTFYVFISEQVYHSESEFVKKLASKINRTTHKIWKRFKSKPEMKVLNGVQNFPECKCQRKYFYPPLKENLTILNSSCSDEGTFYQSGQKVVSFSLHIPTRNRTDAQRRNDIKFYIEGIKLNLGAMRKYYPGHSIRIYTDEPLKDEYCSLVCNSSDLFWCDVRVSPSLGNRTGFHFFMWRFFPLGDPTVDYFLSRDLDSLITPREVAVVQDWLKLDNKAFHVMRDHMVHYVPMLAGMWGARNGLLRDAEALRKKIIERSGGPKQWKGLDQDVLRSVVFQSHKQDIVAYDSYHCKYFANDTLMRPFPTKRNSTNNDFVGSRSWGRDKYNLKPCPVECRPEFGKGWEYC